MNCRNIDELLLMGGASGPAPLPASAAEHLRACDRCSGLLRAAQMPARSGGPSPAMLERLKRDIVASLRPVKPLPPSRYFIAAFLLIFVLLTAGGVYQLGWRGLRRLSDAQKLSFVLVFAASGILLAASLAQQMTPGQVRRPRPAAIIGGVLAALLAAAALLFHQFDPRNLLREGLPCLRTGLVFVPPAALALWAVLRRGLVLAPVWAGASAGTLAGLIGVAVLQMHCANQNFWHIMTWHLTVILLSAAAGALLGVFGRVRLHSPPNGNIPASP